MPAKIAPQFVATSDGRFRGLSIDVRCVLGKAGCLSVEHKIEGDGASPIGVWPMLRVFWRDDRVEKPKTILPTVPIQENYGWCDDSQHPNYNQLIQTPFYARHETLWRDDHIYDIIVELGYNLSPVISGKGSAIFLHIAKSDFSPTEGCVALTEADLREVLTISEEGSALEIRAVASDGQ